MVMVVFWYGCDLVLWGEMLFCVCGFWGELEGYVVGECGEMVKRLLVCIYFDVCLVLMCEYILEIVLSLFVLLR